MSFIQLEPKDRVLMCSDFTASNKTIERIDSNLDRVTNIENGNVSIYHYKKGILVSDSSEVTAIAENIIPGSGSLATGSSVVVGSSTRTSVRLPDINGWPAGTGVSALGPSDLGNDIEYVERGGS